MTTPPEAVTLAEAARRMGIPPATMETGRFRARLVVRGLRTAKVGRRVVVITDSILPCLKAIADDGMPEAK
jgi:hypothetical protein